jgi:hypothetical protein
VENLRADPFEGFGDGNILSLNKYIVYQYDLISVSLSPLTEWNSIEFILPKFFPRTKLSAK